jgi:hypothetical protein
MAEFDSYQGASTISHKTLAWKRSKISVFELDILPQSWMPYGFEYYFVDEEFVVDREFGLSSE